MDITCILSYLFLGVVGLLAACLCGLYYDSRSGKFESDTKLTGKTVIVTGANTGIGKETAKDMAKRGATVVIACRNMEKGNDALQEIKVCSNNCNVFVRKLDLGSLKSVREFADNFLKEFKELHILINNAGIYCPYTKTEDGFEMQFGVNHLGHFALTNLLLKRLVECGPSRIVNVTSSGHIFFECMDLDDLHWQKRSYSNIKAYGQSKLANVLFTKELHKRLGDKNVKTFAVHPGSIKTEITRHSWFLTYLLNTLSLLLKTLAEGAQTTVYCAVDEEVINHSGEYFHNCKRSSSSKMSYDEGLAKKLWEKSEELTKINFPL